MSYPGKRPDELYFPIKIARFFSIGYGDLYGAPRASALLGPAVAFADACDWRVGVSGRSP
jgi:hypothetical protein